MRTLVVLVLALPLLAATPAAAVETRSDGDGDDPKAGAATPRPDATVRAATPAREHANPRLKLSYRGFGIANVDATTVGLKGAQLDVYPLSRRYVRLGIEAEAGAGDATYGGASASLWYGMGGVTAGFQYPARVTPFVEGRFAAGALGAQTSGTSVTVGGVTVNSGAASAVTLMYVGGVDAGIELYTVSRLYVSAAIGWAHPTYTGLDYAAMQANPTGGMKLRQVENDSFTFKIGFGI